MSYPYPRGRREIFCVGGIFDDFSDTALSATKWFDTFTAGNVVKSFVSAPGGAGGNALRLLGTIGNGIGLAGCGTVGPFPNKSGLYYVSPLNPYLWKMKAEFRMYIHDDEPDAGNLLSHSAGFCLDGAVNCILLLTRREPMYYSMWLIKEWELVQALEPLGNKLMWFMMRLGQELWILGTIYGLNGNMIGTSIRIGKK